MPRRVFEVLELNVRRIAKRRGRSLESIATEAGITHDQLLAIFAGKFDPDVRVRVAIGSGHGFP